MSKISGFAEAIADIEDEIIIEIESEKDDETRYRLEEINEYLNNAIYYLNRYTDRKSKGLSQIK